MPRISRREWLGRVTASAAGSPRLAQAAKPPNVILIMTDDQGWGDLSCHGNPHLKTPNLDRLARDGVEFTRFYVSPVCSPTRASLLTGRYHLRCGVHNVTHGRETMRLDETTLAEALRPAGYSTALIGKWHLGEHYPYVPHGQGFDEFIGFRTGNWPNYFDSSLERNGKPYQLRGYITDAFTSEAIRFIEGRRSQPFFLYLAYNAPHMPFQAPAPYFERYKSLDIPGPVAATYSMVASIDDNIGRLLGRLEELGLSNDTIVIFLTDNGPAVEHFNGGMRGRKATVYEGGVRVPLFVRWPGKLPAGKRIGRIAAHIDIYPTVLDLCGVRPPKGLPIDGRSLVPLMRGAPGDWPDRMLFTHSGLVARSDPPIYPGAVRTERFNLVNGTELYDMENDPAESRNVAAEHPGITRKLRGAYEEWFREASRERGFVRLPIPVGYREENPVMLPAPQCYMHGGLKFANGPGFAHDWVTGWRGLDDSVDWEIDVVRGGRYAVSLKYLCPDTSLGSKVRVAAGGVHLEATVIRATPMKPKPSPDVVPGLGSTEMEWGVLRLGALVLEKGKATLTVRALAKPGEMVMDLKEAVLERLE